MYGHLYYNYAIHFTIRQTNPYSLKQQDAFTLFSYPSFHCSVAASSATKMAYSSAAYFSQSVSSCPSFSTYRMHIFSEVTISLKKNNSRFITCTACHLPVPQKKVLSAHGLNICLDSEMCPRIDLPACISSGHGE